jgi:putative transposase
MTAHKHLHRLPVTLPMEATIIYYVTCCTHNRRQLFASESLVKLALDELVQSRKQLHWWVGGVVFMPDHVHLFCGPPDRQDPDLSRFIGAWRAAVSRQLKQQGLEEPFWQKSFHDHILRSDESYGNKWEYVRQNPDRAGLKDFQRWFEVDRIEFR